jgi:hypothetical protein
LEMKNISISEKRIESVDMFTSTMGGEGTVKTKSMEWRGRAIAQCRKRRPSVLPRCTELVLSRRVHSHFDCLSLETVHSYASERHLTCNVS